ncbi:hypothetical protein KP509_10G047600 [Ceratopteris richardii]|uniref:Uncharacterized protein n=1 Tax=Ceratopteris richardii TaxID=49495 RepID=A0A8T2U129_CERRI|nr:hypothetical protein KP509_10G047600 [Ceratopteris richardii]
MSDKGPWKDPDILKKIMNGLDKKMRKVVVLSNTSNKGSSVGSFSLVSCQMQEQEPIHGSCKNSMQDGSKPPCMIQDKGSIDLVKPDSNKVDTQHAGNASGCSDDSLAYEEKHVVSPDETKQGVAVCSVGTAVHICLNRAIPLVFACLKIIVSFLLHILKSHLPITKNEVQQNDPLCNKDPDLNDRVAKLEDTIHKIQGTINMPPGKCTCCEITSARIRTLEFEITETKKALHHVTLRQTEIHDELKQFKERKATKRCFHLP